MRPSRTNTAPGQDASPMQEIAPRAERDRGYVLVLTAVLAIPLIVITAFAVDLGAWYAQGTKMQRAVDSAALAGVVWLPDQAEATSAATEVLRRNGFNQTPTISFPSGGQQMRVAINGSGTQFFSQLVMRSPTFSRSATAEFNKPVPLGSPSNTAGNIINSVSSCPQFQPSQASGCGPQPMLWQAIQGPYETHGNGDAYATLCRTGRSGSQCGTPNDPSNPDYQPEGYEYAIDVPESAVGRPLTVEIWDAVSTQRATSTDSRNTTADCNRARSPWNGSWPSGFNYQNCQTGDSGPTDRNGLNMQWQIFDNDGSDLTVTFDRPLAGCELFVPRSTKADPAALETYKNKWVRLCTFTPTKAGIYPMRVKSSNIRRNGSTISDTTSATGWNAYSMRVTGSATAQLYALGNLSMWTNTPGSTARFYLAKISPEHRGKKVILDLFDPGDGNSGTYKLQVLGPATPTFNTPLGGSPLVPPQHGTTLPKTNMADSCKANTRGSPNRGGGTLSTVTNCEVTTRSGSTQYYQDQWLRFEIQLSNNYTCSTDCWWTIKYDFGSGSDPNDRTTWALNVVGDPVHLVE
jgi:hypothetical protein